MSKGYNLTRALCSVCGEKCDAAVIEKDDGVYLEKYCPTHGTHHELFCSDPEWYRRSLSFVKPMTSPKKRSVDSFTGCPESCGLCPEHGQHTCLPVIEINDACDMNCPVCLKTWNKPFSMTADEFSDVIDTLTACEGFVPVINLSGGEPTLNPALPEMLAIAERKGIMQVSISTNGRRILNDPEFRKIISAYNPIIALQFDGFESATYETLRGADLSGEKSTVIETLEKEEFRYSLVATIASGVNLHEVKPVTDFFFASKAVSLMFQPVAYNGHASRMDKPVRRATIPDVVSEIEKCQKVSKGDFNPLPCSHPSCFALSYYINAGNGVFASLKQILGEEAYLDIISNRTLPGLDAEGFRVLQQKVYDIWSAADQYPDGEQILRKIRNVMRDMNECGFSARKVFDLGTDTVKAVFIHQFMDRATMDFGRLMKCCNHYPGKDGKLIPMCAQNTCFS